MITLYVAMEEALLIVRKDGAKWTAEQHLEDRSLQCVALDPGSRGRRIYVGTVHHGLLRSPDGGRTWTPAGKGIPSADITAVAVAPGEAGRLGPVLVGTEPSAVFRSTDGGETWDELEGLSKLPSAPIWSFPPRPETHHVRWIAVDPHDPQRLYVAIEAGALVRSFDGGRTWLDRAPNGPYDTHTLALHARARGRLYSAAGDGYYESLDEGRTWASIESGLRHGYLFGLAVDPADPETVVVSAASGPGNAYTASTADSHIYVKRNGSDWASVRNGLPEPKGTTVSFLASLRNEPHVIYAANNRGIFRSPDAGASWQGLDVPWPQEFFQQSVQGLVLEARH